MSKRRPGHQNASEKPQKQDSPQEHRVTPEEHVERVRQDRDSERDVILGYPSADGGERQDERDANGEGYETERSGAV
jgi:hypothetical protein